jgi:hypothetical protein
MIKYFVVFSYPYEGKEIVEFDTEEEAEKEYYGEHSHESPEMIIKGEIIINGFNKDK